MNRSPLHPLRLLPALLATADQGRRHFEDQIGQWLTAQSAGESDRVGESVEGHAEQTSVPAAPGDRPAPGTASIPPAGETIPKTGQ